MAERQNLNTKEIAVEETKLLFKIRTKHQIFAKSLAVVEYDVYIENYRLQAAARQILAKFPNITCTSNH